MAEIIVKGIGGLYFVKSDNGDVHEYRARGLFRKNGIKPMIGDRVVINNGSIAQIEPRKNFLIRPPVSNIDNLVIVVAATSPEPDYLLIDKMLVNAEIAGINPIICINKTDLASGEELEKIYSLTRYPVIDMCAEKNIGTDKLMPYLKGNITAFSGISGVGKSTILNIITGKNMQTGNVSEKIQRGKHTTRHIELFELDCGGYVLDTPGFGSLEVTDVSADELDRFFPEFRTDACRFNDCTHINEPGCEVKAKLEKGSIAKTRYESYCNIYEVLKKIKNWEK